MSFYPQPFISLSDMVKMSCRVLQMMDIKEQSFMTEWIHCKSLIEINFRRCGRWGGFLQGLWNLSITMFWGYLASGTRWKNKFLQLIECVAGIPYLVISEILVYSHFLYAFKLKFLYFYKIGIYVHHSIKVTLSHILDFVNIVKFVLIKWYL